MQVLEYQLYIEVSTIYIIVELFSYLTKKLFTLT